MYVNNEQGWPKAKSKDKPLLGHDYPSRPAQLGIYDQITL